MVPEQYRGSAGELTSSSPKPDKVTTLPETVAKSLSLTDKVPGNGLAVGAETLPYVTDTFSPTFASNSGG